MPGNEELRIRRLRSRDQIRLRPGTVAGVILAAGLVLGLSLLSQRVSLTPMIETLEDRVRGLGTWGPVFYGLIYVAAVAALVPSSPLTMAAGAIFGPTVGTATASLASTTGAAVSFLISRYLARGLVTRKLGGHPRFAAIDREVSRSGVLIVALLRLSPAVPFGLQNYLYGLTGIRFGPYVLTSWAAMLPGTLMYAYIGYLGRASLDSAVVTGRTRSRAEWAFLAVGLIATVAVTIVVTRLARRALKESESMARP
jgi:uncharacterized membrane protein YdjX (TVP38/TMEM64 family)